MSQRRTSGIVAATLTPVDDPGAPCMVLLIEHCRRLLAAGCESIVLLGTTGEANSFSSAERRTILEATVTGGIAPSKLIVGTGCCAVPDTVGLTSHALSLGIERVLVLPPFYYKDARDDGIIEAYARTIETVNSASLRLYLYRIPQLTDVDINASVIEALLAKYPSTIAGIKDSSGDWATMRPLCERFGAALDVLVGNERFLLDALAAGASGCVTATANVQAAALSELYANRDGPTARALQERVSATRAVFEAVPMIPALKGVVAHRTGDARWRNVRPPLTRLSQTQAATLLNAVPRS